MAGGCDGFKPLSSTEVLASTSSAWVLVNDLPRNLHELKGVTISNRFFITGEYDIVGWGTGHILIQVDLTMTVMLERR